MSHRLLTLSLVVFQCLGGCTSASVRSETHHFDGCVAGKACTITGKLTLHPGQPAWAALLVAGNECAKLALPDTFYAESRTWNGRTVVVTGRAFEQPSLDEDGGVFALWYTELERKLPMGMCDSGIGIYVDTMRSRNGRSWPPLSK